MLSFVWLKNEKISQKKVESYIFSYATTMNPWAVCWQRWNGQKLIRGLANVKMVVIPNTSRPHLPLLVYSDFCPLYPGHNYWVSWISLHDILHLIQSKYSGISESTIVTNLGVSHTMNSQTILYFTLVWSMWCWWRLSSRVSSSMVTGLCRNCVTSDTGTIRMIRKFGSCFTDGA